MSLSIYNIVLVGDKETKLRFGHFATNEQWGNPEERIHPLTLVPCNACLCQFNLFDEINPPEKIDGSIVFVSGKEEVQPREKTVFIQLNGTEKLTPPAFACSKMYQIRDGPISLLYRLVSGDPHAWISAINSDKQVEEVIVSFSDGFTTILPIKMDAAFSSFRQQILWLIEDIVNLHDGTTINDSAFRTARGMVVDFLEKRMKVLPRLSLSPEGHVKFDWSDVKMKGSLENDRFFIDAPGSAFMFKIPSQLDQTTETCIKLISSN